MFFWLVLIVLENVHDHSNFSWILPYSFFLHIRIPFLHFSESFLFCSFKRSLVNRILDKYFKSFKEICAWNASQFIQTIIFKNEFFLTNCRKKDYPKIFLVFEVKYWKFFLDLRLSSSLWLWSLKKGKAINKTFIEKLKDKIKKPWKNKKIQRLDLMKSKK